MQIGEAADRVGLSVRTIRHYEEAGLIVPSARSEGGFRLYTEPDLDRLAVVKRMKPLGFTLDEMRDLLTVLDALGTATGVFVGTIASDFPELVAGSIGHGDPHVATGTAVSMV
ncbi:MerR family transcriptional regulator, partial [Micromonospora sp. DH15]|nr:MerR family transcriptional regulator [Micromonospora sp. DH15]